jgi:hypothetical protein
MSKTVKNSKMARRYGEANRSISQTAELTPTVWANRKGVGDAADGGGRGSIRLQNRPSPHNGLRAGLFAQPMT